MAETPSVGTLEAISTSHIAIGAAFRVIAIYVTSPCKPGCRMTGRGIVGTGCAGIKPEIGRTSSIAALGNIAIFAEGTTIPIDAASPRFEPQSLANQGTSKEFRAGTVGRGFAGMAGLLTRVSSIEIWVIAASGNMAISNTSAITAIGEATP